MGLPIIGDVIDAVKDIVSEVVVDKDKKRELDVELQRIADAADQRAHEEILAQIEVNKVEASSGSLFVAGWRPFVGWVCGIGLAAQVILFPLLDRVFHWKMEFDTELLILTMSGMLGIGAMRSYEKVRGVSTNDYTDTPQRATEVRLVAPSTGPKAEALPEEAPWA